MRRQPLVLLLVTLAIVAIANVASELGKPVSRALSDRERDGPRAWPSRNKEEERMGAETTGTWSKPLALVFKMLRLHKVQKHQLFERRRFRFWVQYMKLFHPKNPERAMLLTLHSIHNDKDVATMILNAKQVTKTERLATRLQTEQLQLWKTQNKPPEDVFEWLQLDTKKAKDLAPLVSNPEYATWKEYVKLISKKPEEVKEKMAHTLTTQSADLGLTLMVSASKKKEHLKEVATALHQGQLEMWKREKIKADNLFEGLQLNLLLERQDASLDAFLQSPVFGTWKEYVVATTKPEDVHQVMVQTLAKYLDKENLFNYRLMRLLIVSKYSDDPSVAALATQLQQAQLELWLEMKVSPADVHQRMDLKKNSWMDFFRKKSDEENVWRKYKNDFKAMEKKERQT
ncbi:hypothetical protein PsorP6_015631 [Peronosclerospora sorghi]|uniref:Uncharacterized protein n=1 Tax=Peronosclerospora sorghi TaxID=230839 RepID=A0ACC0WML8_9STRA|nr:hypothetical protein PsorP6_015631 [Peronosclerospora sorghi]